MGKDDYACCVVWKTLVTGLTYFDGRKTWGYSDMTTARRISMALNKILDGNSAILQRSSIIRESPVTDIRYASRICSGFIISTL